MNTMSEPLTARQEAASEPATLRALRVTHETRYRYAADVELAHHVGLLRPRATPTQKVSDWHLTITPVPDEAPGATEGEGGVRQAEDVWGNWRCWFSHSRVHDELVVVSTFLAELAPPEPIDPDASPMWEQVVERLRYRPGVPLDDALEFSLPSSYAPRDPQLAAFARTLFRPRTPLLAGACEMTRHIFEHFKYRPAATSVATRAPEALALREGVCQDFAHVLIGAMRSLGLAARYVSGYLLTQPPPGQPRLVGADASHAWVEVWCPVHGWVALDPTNGVRAGQDHVTLAWGRDYADVAPLRGVIRGGGEAVPHVAVTVEPIDEDASEQG